MARGDGKAQRGYTRGKSVIKMAAGGNLAARDAAMGGAAVGSRAEATRSTSSGGLGAGSGGFGASTREGGFGGAGRGYPDDRRVDLRGNPNTFARTERTSALTSPDAMMARLGPNAAQAMVDAGLDPELARLAADSINKRASYSPSTSGKISPDRAFPSAAPAGTLGSFGPAKPRPALPERIFPSAAPASTLGSFGPAATSSTAPVAPAKSPMDVYGDEFSFTPVEARKALESMYWKGLPGASYDELKNLGKAMGTRENKALAASLMAPFSSKTRAPVKSISEKIPQDPSYSSKYQESLLGTNEPVVSSPGAAKNTTLYKTSPAPVKTQPKTGSVGAQTPRAEASFTPKPKAKPASAPTKKAAPKEGSVFVKDGVRYQIRGGKAYNFNVPGGSKRVKPEKDRRFGEGDPGGLRNKRDGGVVRKTDGAATRGKTRGRYI